MDEPQQQPATDILRDWNVRRTASETPIKFVANLPGGGEAIGKVSVSDDECVQVEVTVTMRVPMSESTYRKLKAAASLRGVGQGQLAAQIIEESLPQFMNFGPGGESFPFERPSA